MDVLNESDWQNLPEDDPFSMITTSNERPPAAAAEEYMRRRLDACSKGLLEVSVTAPRRWFAKREQNQQMYKVNFLHQTARDFLLSKEMQQALQEKVSESFNPRRALVRVMLARARRVADPLDSSSESYVFNRLGYIDNMIKYARIVEIHDGVAELDTLNAGEKFMEGPLGALEPVNTNIFLGVLASNHLHLYIQSKLEQDPEIIELYGDSLLEYTLSPWRTQIVEEFRAILDPKRLRKPQRGEYDIAMIKLLLESGVSPRRAFSEFITDLLVKPVEEDKRLQVIALLLQHGAASFNEAVPHLK